MHKIHICIRIFTIITEYTGPAVREPTASRDFRESTPVGMVVSRTP